MFRTFDGWYYAMGALDQILVILCFFIILVLVIWIVDEFKSGHR